MICHRIVQVSSPSTSPTTSFQKLRSSISPSPSPSSSSKPDLVLIAKFDPADPSSWSGEIRRREKELVVYPEGRDLMDIVMMSMMVAERLRLMLPS